MRGWQALVLLGFGALTVNCGLRFGSEWEIGRLGMPSTMLAADGKHHPNGDEVEAVTLSLARSGYEQEVWWVIFGVLAACFIYLYIGYRQLNRRRMDIFRRELRRHLGLPPEETPGRS
jgi:hypothetical protein